MMIVYWCLVIVGGLLNFLAKPCLNRLHIENESLLYIIKIIAMCLVIAGAMAIFITGGKV